MTRNAARSATAGARPRERDLIARWGAGAWRGWRLRAADGALYTVLFQGRPGGPAGPDFRDAVLADANGARLTGDIELHLDGAGWRAHGHGADPRYNGLALHIILTAGPGARAEATTLASGRRAPLVVLAEQPTALPASLPAWPCAGFMARTTANRRRALLEAAGWARFEQRVAAFAETLASPAVQAGERRAGWDAADGALFVALAEGLGYGRDRDALRHCGERLARGEPPDALLTTAERLLGVERRRMAGLLALRDRWRDIGPLAELSERLSAGYAQAGESGAARRLTEALVVAERGAVSPGRARILAFNVALPYIAAVAACAARSSPPTRSAPLEASLLARGATARLPGLPSNQITREMTRQLGLPRLPSGALAQQGLHYLWASHCQSKSCAGCPCALGD